MIAVKRHKEKRPKGEEESGSLDKKNEGQSIKNIQKKQSSYICLLSAVYLDIFKTSATRSKLVLL